MFRKVLTGFKRFGASHLVSRPDQTRQVYTSKRSFITNKHSLSPKCNKLGFISSRILSSSAIMEQEKKLVAVCQMNCNNDKEKNFSSAEDLIRQAAVVGSKMIFLPECFDFIGATKQEAIDAAEPLDGPTVSKYRDLARSLKVWLSLGGMHQKNPDPETKKILNAHIVIDDQGEIQSIYHKVHLFNLEIPNVTRLIESESYTAGDRLPEPVETPVGKIGLGICYDLRFGEMAIAYAKAGADILTYPSSFTVPTGTYHWETLIRSRAIENQCYVVAAAQVGVHNPKRASYGHAMIVDPWGTKIAECSEGVGFAVGLVDKKFLQTSRSKLPIWSDRRNDIYADIEPAVDKYPIENQEYFFQDFNIPPSQVFYRTRYSYAFVNHRPVLHGHVLVSPLRVCKKFRDLSRAEVTDLMLLVHKVEKKLEQIYETESTTITIQDGVDAGQSVFHVHVHLLPRKPTDFGGNIDKIYRELQRHDKAEFKKEYRKLSQEEMAVIAKRLHEAM